MILSKEDIRVIKSKSKYWDEVAKREWPTEILRQELQDEVSRIGVKILWVLRSYVKIQEELGSC